MIVRHERPDAPAMFWPLVRLRRRHTGRRRLFFRPVDQLRRLEAARPVVIVPVVYRWARGASARTVSNVIVSVGAIVAAYGIVQYSILEFDTRDNKRAGPWVKP